MIVEESDGYYMITRQHNGITGKYLLRTGDGTIWAGDRYFLREDLATPTEIHWGDKWGRTYVWQKQVEQKAKEMMLSLREHYKRYTMSMEKLQSSCSRTVSGPVYEAWIQISQ